MDDIEILRSLRNAHINDFYKGKRISVTITKAIQALQENEELKKKLVPTAPICIYEDEF